MDDDALRDRQELAEQPSAIGRMQPRDEQEPDDKEYIEDQLLMALLTHT